jgi:hypothetical protein
VQDIELLRRHGAGGSVLEARAQQPQDRRHAAAVSSPWQLIVSGSPRTSSVSE